MEEQIVLADKLFVKEKIGRINGETNNLNSAHHVDPCPPSWIPSPIAALDQHQPDYPKDTQHARSENCPYRLSDSPFPLPSAILVKAPNPLEIHAPCRQTQHDRMPREHDIIASHRGLRADWISRGILCADQRRIVERGSGEEVGDET